MPFTAFSPVNTVLWPGAQNLPNPNLGIAAENYPHLLAQSPSGAIAAGALCCVRFDLPANPVSFSSLVYGVTGAGATLTAGQNFCGLYDSNGQPIGTGSADQSGIWTATGLKQTAIGGGPFATRWPFIVAAFLFNGTTAPTFARSVGVNIGPSICNLNAPAASLYVFNNGTGLTALPASLNYANNTVASGNPQYIWCGLV